MTFSSGQILAFMLLYLGGLFAVAYLADRRILPTRLTRHPLVYVLSLGVLSGAMATYGILDIAFQYGYGFLLYYVGVVVMFLLGSLLLFPLLHLCRVYQLSSLADVLTFRFRSQRVGSVVTVGMCLAVLPLLALQIQAVADVIHILTADGEHLLTGSDRRDGLALVFCLIVTLFTILFGTRHVSSQQRHDGLVTAIAFESLLKLLAMLIVGGTAVYTVFGSFDGLETWLTANPNVTELLQAPLRLDSARALLLIFFAGAVTMPHMFHMLFAENADSDSLKAASWGLPLFLLLLSLPVLPTLWAGLKLQHDLPQAYTAVVLGLELQSVTLSAAAFVAGLSAASATIIVTTLALANMCLSHLILPIGLAQRSVAFDPQQDIYAQLKWLRRVLIAGIILAGYLTFRFISGRETLSQLGLVAFIGTLQFLPGIIATLYWPGANRKGLLTGLVAGFGIWSVTLLLPVFGDLDPQFIRHFYLIWFDDLESRWAAGTIVSLGVNILLFILVSLLTPTQREERIAAEICSMDDLNRPTRQTLAQKSPGDFAARLASDLGESSAQAEVKRALQELRFDDSESRPYALRSLRARIEANLSGLMGPSVAHQIVKRALPFVVTEQRSSEDINLIERRLDTERVQFTGLAADLDNLRRHHRETLHNLPIGLVSLGADHEILMWNSAMESITAIEAQAVVGSHLSSLDQPWRDILTTFSDSEQSSILQQHINDDSGQDVWVSLHKAASRQAAHASEDQVIVVEDISDYYRLEQELLHSERLASVGRLAAGVAHEIGNPVTGIACLAQNLNYEQESEEVREAAADILKQTDRISRIVESLVNFSHSGTGKTVLDTELIPLNIADCVDEAIHLLQLDHEAKPVQFDNRCDRELLAAGDPQRLLQVFVNLLGNARDASDDYGCITVECRSEGALRLISVTDDGCGIPENLQSQVFEPFFTTKDPGQGTGLGLALVYSIMEDFGGKISLLSPVDAESGRGCRFTLQLTAAQYPDGYMQ